MTERTSAWASEVGFVENLKTISDHCKAVSRYVKKSVAISGRLNARTVTFIRLLLLELGKNARRFVACSSYFR